ncbi:hypothetical protein PPYR_08699 [Photinus pyralis]|uniref:Cap-specific mRNA (nucleoside-2'-O-)-methyltransferase 1 n=1 Tax=Photinus pyralis TaxID=7054 RepID=A0A1Y1NGJ6_PHOPY|nr:cap-specific mRNA (nucleoside-2'-O-)-methyltransferase 1-like [Photinus pyralis]XP_031356431.1 cap-specific mRNA (nucleoside-2'-O-)-methyltransferase 1-like [Photinus pyralis]KAB0797706.1 hypothetical protein PPYR_08699 [Photinus pyralis]
MDFKEPGDKEPRIVETVNWIANEKDFSYTFDEMLQWIVEGSPILEIDNETHFCDWIVLQEIIAAKAMYDKLDLKKLYKARNRANSFEMIGSVFFMNRAALKMANIDAATNFIFTNIDQSVEHRRSYAPYYFADVCAGPGGFSEYVLWRKKWLFKGFGFTLKSVHDFEMNRSRVVSPVTFNSQYGFYKDGDIFKLENIEHFAKNVKHETEGLGVHFMMSDGAFSVEGKENLQEILSKQIYLCQCLMALKIVRSNGHFVTKVFDLFTPFSVGLVYLMYKCFRKVAILKPNASRPANAERYLICYGLQNSEQTALIRNYLTHIARRLSQIHGVDRNNTVDVNGIVPLTLLKGDEEFFDYIEDSNNRIGEQQIAALRNLEKYYHNPELYYPTHQERLRLQCLKYWNIPESFHRFKPKSATDNLLASVRFWQDLINNEAHLIRTYDDLNKFLTVSLNSNEWCYVLSACTAHTNICTFYSAMDDSNVCRLQQSNWVNVKKLKLIAGTILFGEMVKETVVEDNGRKTRKRSLHVIDALRLGHKSIANLPFTERMANIEVYCQAVNHESRLNNVRIRAKRKLETLTPSVLDGDNHFRLPVLGYKSREESYQINSVLLLNSNKDLTFQISFTSQRMIFLSKTAANENADGTIKLALHSLITAMNNCRKLS